MEHLGDAVPRSGIWRAAAPAAVLVALGAVLFSSSGRDDCYITYWSAHALATLGQIVNYNGDPVEQSSSLTHVLLLAGLARLLPLPLPTLGALLSIMAGVGTVLVTRRLARMLNPRISDYAGWLAGTSASLTYWAYSGLDAALAAFLGAGLVLLSARAIQTGWTGSTTLLMLLAVPAFVMVRPEAPLVLSAAMGLVVVLLLLQGRVGAAQARRGALVLAAVGVSFGVMAIFRRSYFGSYFPQPVSAKVGHASMETVRTGIKYLVQQAWMRWDAAVWIFAPVMAAGVFLRSLLRRGVRPIELIVAAYCAAHLGFVVVSGGGWMEGARHLVPILPMGIALALLLMARTVRSMQQRSVVSVLVLLQLVAMTQFARQQSTGGPPWAAAHIDPAECDASVSWFTKMNRDYYREYVLASRLKSVVDRMHLRLGRPVRVLGGQMGGAAYHVARSEFGKVRFIDLFGLVTRDVTDSVVMARRPRGSVGVHMTYSYYFEQRATQRDPSAPLWNPDVIFDTTFDGKRVPLMERYGYAIVYQQDGLVLNGSHLIPGLAVRGGEFIAVRRDLLSPDLRCRDYAFSSFEHESAHVSAYSGLAIPASADDACEAAAQWSPMRERADWRQAQQAYMVGWHLSAGALLTGSTERPEALNQLN